MPDSTTPAEFNPIFRQGVPIIGGHAVNLWATYYSGRGDQELRAFAPFISKDGDIYLRDAELAQAIANTAGWVFEKNPEPRSAVLGRIVLEKGGVRLDVHVMREVNGLSEADLAKTETLTLEDGTVYCLPAPDIMLKAKLSNLNTIDQEKRQDERHTRIMISCCRHYLSDSFEACRSGKLSEREAVERFMSAHRITTSSVAKQLDGTYNLNLGSAIPSPVALSDLFTYPKFRAFYEHQIQKIRPRMGM